MKYEEIIRAFNISCEKLNLDVIDLYSIHWPIESKIVDTWRALERLYEEKRVRSIGVSNFCIKDLEKLSLKANISPLCN